MKTNTSGLRLCRQLWHHLVQLCSVLGLTGAGSLVCICRLSTQPLKRQENRSAMLDLKLRMATGYALSLGTSPPGSHNPVEPGGVFRDP